MATYVNIPPSTGGGIATVTTATATPTVALPSGVHALSISISVNVTKLIVTGLDLAADGGYNFDGLILGDGTHAVNVSLNDSDATGVIKGFFVGAPTSFSPNLMQLTDGINQNGQFFCQLRHTGTGAGKAWNANFTTNVPQWYVGVSTLTANVTSFSVPQMLAGSLINIRRA